MRGCRLFGKDRMGRRGRGVALYVREQLECVELCLGMDEVGQAKAQMELSLARDVKDNKASIST